MVSKYLLFQNKNGEGETFLEMTIVEDLKEELQLCVEKLVGQSSNNSRYYCGPFRWNQQWVGRGEARLKKQQKIKKTL